MEQKKTTHFTSVINSTSATSTTTTFPLTSKRLKQSQMQRLAKRLELPALATGSDLLVMITGRLRESNHDPTNVQVVVSNSEEGEELSLQDMDGVFLRLPTPKKASLRTPPLLDRESSVPSLMSGSSRTSPVSSVGEAGEVISENFVF